MFNGKMIVPYADKGSTFDEMEMDAIRTLLMDPNITLSCGQERKLFEQEFASYVGSRFAFTLTSCTLALEFATYLLKLKPGDQVIATPFTYQATTQPFLGSQIELKFCDIDENSLCVDIESIKRLTTDKTRAIYLTHYAGFVAEMDNLMAFAKEHNIIVVEDCAHAIGSSYKGRKAGNTADIGCFSFHSMKNMSTLGEGGMITFNNPEWAEIVNNIRSIEPHAVFVPRDIKFGTIDKKNITFSTHQKNAFTHECIKILHGGTNSTLSDVACAVGRVQLKKLNEFTAKRREIATFLNQALMNLDEIRVQSLPSYIEHAHHLYMFFLKPEYEIDRDEFVKLLISNGIEIVLRYFPIHLLPEWRFKGGEYGQCPVTEDIWFNQLVNLPCFPMLEYEQLEYMVKSIKKALHQCADKRKIYSS